MHIAFLGQTWQERCTSQCLNQKSDPAARLSWQRWRPLAADSVARRELAEKMVAHKLTVWDGECGGLVTGRVGLGQPKAWPTRTVPELAVGLGGKEYDGQVTGGRAWKGQQGTTPFIRSSKLIGWKMRIDRPGFQWIFKTVWVLPPFPSRSLESWITLEAQACPVLIILPLPEKLKYFKIEALCCTGLNVPWFPPGDGSG